MDRGLNSERGTLLPVAHYDKPYASEIIDRRWSGVVNVAKGFAGNALGAGFFYAAQTGTGDNVMIPILYAGGVGFMIAGTIIVTNGFRKLCCGVAHLCGRDR